LRLGTEEGLPEPIFPRASRWLYRRVLNKLHTQLGPRLLLATDTTLIGDDFEFLIKRPVASISLPIDVPEPAALRAEKPVHLVFPSVAVSERGFHLLPDALEVALQRCPLLSATVRVASPRKSYAPLIARLSAMAPRVHLVHGPLDESKFYALLADAHAVLLPYDPFTWAKRSSQILAQSAALGRPVIVMRGSFLDYECQAAGIVGVTAEAFTAEALADAICRFVKDRERLVAEAWAACPEQRRRHSVGAFMDRLVEFAEGCERQNSSALTTGRVVWPA
ncbi:MAG: glycosyltransferase, partial [Proteobacteria bacterium]|nr:glycosyltransferase [Pseudomonadota bacterium]